MIYTFMERHYIRRPSPHCGWRILFRILRRKRNAENATSYFISIPVEACPEKRERIMMAVNYILLLLLYSLVSLRLCRTDRPTPQSSSHHRAYTSLGSPRLSPSLDLVRALSVNENRTKADENGQALSSPNLFPVLLTRPFCREYAAAFVVNPFLRSS